MSSFSLFQQLNNPVLWGLLMGLLLRSLHPGDSDSLKHLTSENAEQAEVLETNNEIPIIKEETNAKESKDSDQKKEDAKETKFVRPRFVKDELNISKSILVAVIKDKEGKTSLTDHFLTKQNVYNYTLDHFVSDTLFFGNFTQGEASANSARVRLSKNSVLEALKEICRTYLDHYQLFYLVPSTAVINGRNLKKYTDTLDPFQQIYTGRSSGLAGSHCSLESGILLSRAVLKEVGREVEWCLRNAHSYDDSENLDTCISYSAKFKCQEKNPFVPYQAIRYSPALLQDSIIHSKAILYYGVMDRKSEQHLMQDLNEYNEEFYGAKVVTLESSLISFTNSSQLENGNRQNHSWPLGSSYEFRSKDRFDRDNFLMFNKTHSANNNDYDIFSSLRTLEVNVASNMMNLCVASSPSSHEIEYSRGWMKLDATRGLDFLFDIRAHKSGQKSFLGKTCNAVKELARPQVMKLNILEAG